MRDPQNYTDDAIVNPETQHEVSDVNVRALLWFVAIFIVFAAVTHLALWLLFRFFVELEKGNVSAPLTAVARPGDANIPPEPRLQPFPRRAGEKVLPPNMNTPFTDMAEMRAAEDRVLKNYGWVDQRSGTVRIPIEEAKKLALQRNLFKTAISTGAPESSPAREAARAPLTTTGGTP